VIGKTIIQGTPSLPLVQRGVLGAGSAGINYGVLKGIETMLELKKKNQDKASRSNN